MRVLLVNKYLYVKGGSETHMKQLGDCLSERGHTIQYWGIYDSAEFSPRIDVLLPKKREFRDVRGFDRVGLAFSYIYSARCRKLFKKQLNEFKPDVVHVHNFNYQLTTSILSECQVQGIPVVWTVHDPQLVCPFHRFYNYEKQQICTKCLGCKFYQAVWTRCFHGSLLMSLIGAMESYYNHCNSIYDRTVAAIISPSEFLANFIRTSYKGSVHVVPNFTRPLGENEFEVEGDRKHLLYFGRVSKEKGVADLAELCSRLAIPLKIVGTGEDVERVKGLAHIEYLGPLYGAELAAQIAQAAFTIHPSKWYENCPMTIIESYSYSTPVIAPRHSGFIELVDSGITGFLYEDEKVLETFLLAWKNGDEVAPQIPEGYFDSRFGIEQQVERITEIYNSVLSAGH